MKPSTKNAKYLSSNASNPVYYTRGEEGQGRAGGKNWLLEPCEYARELYKRCTHTFKDSSQPYAPFFMSSRFPCACMHRSPIRSKRRNRFRRSQTVRSCDLACAKVLFMTHIGAKGIIATTLTNNLSCVNKHSAMLTQQRRKLHTN